VAFVARHELLPAGARVLLMLSGGPDSMALLALVRLCDRRRRLGLRLSALHVDYGLRGADSDRDRRLTQQACAAAGVPLEIVRPDPPLTAPDFQEKARRYRLAAARRLSQARGHDLIAVGHNLDDQAETILYRLAKYAAPSSLVGMAPRAGRLVRPLLGVRAADVRGYCRRRGIAWGEDHTNREETYARNIVRLSVLPQLERLNPRVVESLGAAADVAREQQALLDELTADAWRLVVAAPADESREPPEAPAAHGGDRQGSESIDLVAFARIPKALQPLVLRRLAGTVLGRDALLDRRLTQALLDLAVSPVGSAGVELRDGWVAVREHRRLQVRPAADHHVCPELRCDIPAPGAPPVAVRFCGRSLSLGLLQGPLPDAASVPATAALGLDEQLESVTLRHPRDGDRFRPLGLGAEVPLQRFLSAQKVPRDERPRSLVVEADGVVAWVEVRGAGAGDAGVRDGLRGRVAESFRVTQSSAFTVCVRRGPVAGRHDRRSGSSAPQRPDRSGGPSEGEGGAG